MSKIPVWIDCDTGVDDAAALLCAGALKELEIVGVSTVAGNVCLEKTTKNTLKVRELMKADFPVYMGADKPWIKPYKDAVDFHGEDGLGGAKLPEPTGKPEEKKAWDALYETAQKYAGELILVAVGPMTNMGTAFTKYPKLHTLIKKVVIMGGAVVGGNTTACAEFNIYTDPHAAEALFSCKAPIVMCGLDVTMKAYLTEEERDRMLKADTPVTRFFKESSGICYRNAEKYGLLGMYLHDVCAILYITFPELFSGKEAGVHVETEGELTLGKTVTDLNSDHQFEEKNALVILDVEREGFIEKVCSLLNSY